MTTTASAKDLPNYNAYDGQRPVTPVLPPSARTLARGVATSMDEQRGVPSFLWAGPSPSGLVPPQIALASHEQAARLHLKKVGPIYGVSEQALATATVTGIHDLGRGGIIVTLRQVIDGVELYRSDVKVLMRRDHDLVAISGSPHPSAVAGMGKNGVQKFTISAENALTNALDDLYEAKLSPSSVLDMKTVKAGYLYFDLLPTPEVKATNLRMSEPARVKKVYFPMPDRLVPAYFVEVLAFDGSGADADAYSYVIAADDGRLLYRVNLKHNAVFNYRVWADDAASGGRPLDGPTVDFTPHPTGAPDGLFPAYITMPPLIAMDGFNTNPNKLSDPWLPAGATETVGNNVDAYVDIFGNDGYSPGQGDFRADVTSPGTFDRIYDLAADPVPNGVPNQTQGKAALAQMFYVTNWLHDWWYDSGFNEAAGNAQKDNYGRGGIAGDPLRAEGEDDANKSSNNANMSAMSDGMSPRMQMYLWKGRSLATLTVNPGNQSYAVGTATFGPPSFSLTAPIVLGVDGTSPVNNGCEALTNNVAGQVVLVDRGQCPFEQKTVNAQTAGAVGIIIANNVPGGPMQMPPPNPPLGGNIPPLSVSQADGATLKAGLMNGMLSASMFNAPAPRADAAIDNTIVAHEWGHYLHLRQVKGCSSQQCGAQGEGWGDYNAAQMIVRPGDNLDGTFALSIYAAVADKNAGYFGIRRFPYSTDMTKNALTFKHIGDGVALPASTPKNPSIGGSNAEVHNAGEVWATMLWEAHVAILKNAQGPNAPYTFAQAQRRMSDYIEGGLLMAPPDPTYTEQRDAILAAAAAADMNDFLILAGAFARRGAGSCARSPAKSSSSLTGVKEGFTVAPEVSIVDARIDDSVASCDTDGVLDAEEKGKVTVTVKNTGIGPLTKTSMTVFNAKPGVSFPNGAMATFGTIAPFSTGTASVEIELDRSIMGLDKLAVTVTVKDPDACSKTETTTTIVPINYDLDQMASSTDDVEIMPSAWTPTSESGPADIWSIQEPMVLTHVWTGVNYGSPSDASLESPPLDVAATENCTLTFNYRHQFDQSMGVTWDGGVIEVSTNDGMTWTDISTYGPVAQYTGTIGDPMNQAVNVLKGRKGFVGQSPSWPAMDSATIDLGNQLAGEAVKIRFRVGSDDGQGAYGWDVDDIVFSGITNKPFPAAVPNTNPCTARPIAHAGANQTVESGALVILDGSKSSDPKMLPLTYAWSALDGPMVTLDGANSVKSMFTAPSVETDTPMIFLLSVSDGKGLASATTHVFVKPSTKSVDGCGCSTVGSPSGAISPLVGVALLALRRRRRTGGRPRG